MKRLVDKRPLTPMEWVQAEDEAFRAKNCFRRPSPFMVVRSTTPRRSVSPPRRPAREPSPTPEFERKNTAKEARVSAVFASRTPRFNDLSSSRKRRANDSSSSALHMDPMALQSGHSLFSRNITVPSSSSGSGGAGGGGGGFQRNGSVPVKEEPNFHSGGGGAEGGSKSRQRAQSPAMRSTTPRFSTTLVSSTGLFCYQVGMKRGEVSHRAPSPVLRSR